MPSSSSNHSLDARAAGLVDGTRCLVLGLAREGMDLTRFLSRHGASVTVVDDKPAEQLQERIQQLGETPRTELRLGSTDVADLARFDVLFTSPGVPPTHPLLQAARAGGVRISSLVQLFFELSPAPILGTTGSAGKTTTTTLVGEMLRADGREVVVGGNIGRPLLGALPEITPQTSVVMELSSFQLSRMTRSPHIGVITNVTPNHLDWHPDMQDYWAAKGHILDFQQADDWAVLNADDAWSSKYRPRARTLRFSLEQPVEHGGWLAGEMLVLDGEPLLAAAEVPLLGRHNLANVLAAACATLAAGARRESMVAAIRGFHGVAHRLQTVGTVRGVRYVNDSIATAPERSIAALRAFQEPLVLIVGGRDKHLPMDEWAALISQRARHVVLLGEMADLVAAALGRVAPEYHALSRAASMDAAVAQAAAAARPGDIVLLSPGGTSFDRYRDFEARGDDFARAVAHLVPSSSGA